jgi:hypothetical protein
MNVAIVTVKAMTQGLKRGPAGATVDMARFFLKLDDEPEA